MALSIESRISAAAAHLPDARLKSLCRPKTVWYYRIVYFQTVHVGLVIAYLHISLLTGALYSGSQVSASPSTVPLSLNNLLKQVYAVMLRIFS